MGLASVYGTIKNHGGALNVVSKPGQGTTMHIFLPQIASDSFPDTNGSRQAEFAGAKDHLLLVDDEEFVLDSAGLMLESAGYKVRTCKNGKEAIQYYRDNWKSIDLIILDMIMPDLSGKDTFIKMKKINPKVRVLLSSGYSIDGEAQKILDKGVKGFIQKPYRRIELARRVAELLKALPGK